MGKEFTPGLISRVMGWVNPRWALRRELSRQALRQFYGAAKTGRATDGWTTVSAGRHRKILSFWAKSGPGPGIWSATAM